MKKVRSILMLILLTFVLIACETGSKQFKITFETNGADNISEVTFKGSYKASDLATPDKKGFAFEGWYLEEDLSEDSRVGSTIKESVTLYAKWSIINYQINYYLDGGINNIKNPQTYTVLDLIVFESPIKEGYKFEGWYIDANFQTKTSGIGLGTVGSQNVYAKFVESTDGGTPVESELGTELNEMFGENVYALMPEVESNDYALSNVSYDGYFEVYIDLFDWTETDANNYTAQLASKLSFDDDMGAYVMGKFYVNIDLFEGYYYIFIVALEEDLTNIEKFEITWKNFDGTIIHTNSVSKGGIPTYDGEIPTKASTATTIYLFSGWTPELTEAFENATYTATFEEVAIGTESFNGNLINSIFGIDIYSLMPQITAKTYKVIEDHYGDLLNVYIDIYEWTVNDADNYDVLLGNMLQYDNEQESYILGDFYIYVYEDDSLGYLVYGIGIYEADQSGNDGGNTGGSAIAEEINAIFGLDVYSMMPAFSTSDFSVTSYSEDGYLFAYIDLFDWTEDAAYDYMDILSVEFLYDDELEAYLMGDFYIFVDLYQGTYYIGVTIFEEDLDNPNAEKFEITWKNYDGTVIHTNTVSEGKIPSYDGQIPTKPNTATTIYLFSGWTPELTEAYGNKTYTATFEEIAKGTETFNGNLINSIFGSDIYSLMPELNVTSYSIIEDHYNGLLNIYIDIYEWTLDDVDYYEVLLADLFTYDYEQESYKMGDVFIYVYEDDSLGYLVYGIGIYEVDELEEEIVDDTTGPNVVLENVQTLNEFEYQQFGKTGLPSEGNFNVLVVPVEINGSPFDANYQSRINIAFNGTSQNTGWESVASYYEKSSFGALNLTFDVIEKVQTVNNKNYFQNKGEDGDQYAIKEVLTALDPSFDFSKYDTNNDGVIDSIIFIYSVEYQDNDPWWAWVYTAEEGAASGMKLDNKEFAYYMWASYSFMDDDLNSNVTINAETYIHELGHLLAFPDLYPYESDGYGPLGGFDMMDYNSGDHGPFNKLIFGWLKPTLLGKGTHEISLDSYSTDTDGYDNALLIPYRYTQLTDGTAFDEFLLVIFYTPQGLYNGHLDTIHSLENAGVIIYHVDARLNTRLTFWGEYFYQNNEGNGNFFINMLEADKNNSMPGSKAISQSDILSSGSLDLSSYYWNQGTNDDINVTVDILSSITDSSSEVSLRININ